MNLREILEYYVRLGAPFIDTLVGPVLVRRGLAGTELQAREVFQLDPDRAPLILGRSSSSDICIPIRNISGKHAEFSVARNATGWQITDLGSTNGTTVDGQVLKPHEPVPLRDRGHLRFGPSDNFNVFLPRSLLGVLSDLQKSAPRKTGRRPRRPQPGPSQRKTVERRGPPPAERRGPPPAERRGPPPAERRGPPPAAEKRGPPRKPDSRGAAPARAPRAQPDRAPARPSTPAPVLADTAGGPAEDHAHRPSTRLPDDFVARLLRGAREAEASDLHLMVGLPPILRINGDLIRREGAPLTCDDSEALIWQVTDEGQRGRFFQTGDLDTCTVISGKRYRLNVCRHRTGCALSFRVIRETVPTLEELGIPEHAVELTKYAQGLVLITGPLGSGKTTTMFSLVNLVNSTRKENIITIEDPVEFIIPPQLCQVAQRERGTHTASFGAALRGALREDPDIIVIGDLRDYETASLAISAAETGHLVFASMATMNAMKTIDKLVDMFPAGEQTTIRTMFSESLRGILCQRLLPGVDGKRVALVEMVFNSIAVANIISQGNTAALMNAMQVGRAQGMRSFETSLDELLKRKAITKETADAARAG